MLLLTCTLVFYATGQKILLPSGIITLNLPENDIPDPIFEKQTGFNGYFFFALQFAQVPVAEQQTHMQQAGVTVLEKLAPLTYLVQSKSYPGRQWCEKFGVTGITPLNPALKTDKFLTQENLPAHAIAQPGYIRVMVGVYQKEQTEACIHALQAAGLQQLEQTITSSGVFSGVIAQKGLDGLAALPFVYAIRLPNPPDKTLNGIARATTGAGLLHAPLAAGGRALSGQGITIGVGDDADPTRHPDIFDRVINHTPGITNNHGTHVSGTVAGNGILVPRQTGMAPGARVVSQWFSGIWQNAGTYADAYRMTITNNSYGSIVGDCVYAGVYDLYSRQLDALAFEQPEMLHAFAAGNDGDNTCAPFPRAYHTVLGGYQSAKNIITTGRTDYTQISSSSSSSGPVKDGRIKPEITALGIITSLNGAGNGYFTEFGTSMSSPVIAGGLGLLYERYRQLHGGLFPQGALMKALLLNGARDAGTPGPDFRHGYGTMMLERSIRMLENNQYQVASISQLEQKDTTITLPAHIAQLRVMLYWHDAPANVLAAKTLVNDLDVMVQTPGGQWVKPRILHADPAAVTQPAFEDTDVTNNQEQVIIENPASGNYTIRVRGSEIGVGGTQPYALVFDAIPAGIHFTSPLAKTAVPAGNVQFPVTWEDETPAGHFYSLALSANNGNTWTDITTSLLDSTRLFFWQPGNLRTTQAKLRISKNGISAETDTFAIIPYLTQSLAPINNQCWGSFGLTWTPLTPVDGETITYRIKLKQGAGMVTVAELPAASNQFTITNLHPDSTWYAAVVAVVNGQEGSYNQALTRRPNTGNCQLAMHNGDLQLDAVLAPQSGRTFTSTQLLSNTPVTVRLRNLDDAAANQYLVKYQINGGAWVEATGTTSIAARSTLDVTLPAADFAATGTYQLTAVVENKAMADPDPANDTARISLTHWENNPVNLSTAFTENFEAAHPISAGGNSIGLAGLSRWDFINTDPLGRARTYLYDGLARSGEKAVTLDVRRAAPQNTQPFNQLIGTFNLDGYHPATDPIRLQFYFKHHGITQVSHPLNRVWIRGSDTQPWVALTDLGLQQPAAAGTWQGVFAINLSDSLLAYGQSFSSSTQIRFGQYAPFSMADNENFGGYTFDDIQLIKAANDLQMLRINNPAPQLCGPVNTLPVQIVLRNGMATPQTNIPVRYRLQQGSWVTENIPSLGANEVLTYTFQQQAVLTGYGTFSLEAEVLMPGDNIPENNTTTLVFIHQPEIVQFPYYEDFDSGAGDFIAAGQNSTWAWGEPASLRIKAPAAGNLSWKTRLTGDYANKELSYLYSPCFNISGLENPMLGFRLAYSFEDCRNFNVVCDAGWMEYALDGGPWQKLGSFGAGQSWYDYEPAQVWMRSTETNWREAMIGLPKHNGTIRMRYVLRSDDASSREGLAIDNFHVYNGSALPLEWLRFNAMLQANQTVALQWQVIATQPGEQFELQVATAMPDETAFKTITTLAANGNNRNFYTYVHQPQTKSLQLYYRIKWLRQNGSYLLSPVRAVRFPAGISEMLVFPNPATQRLQVQANLHHNTTANLVVTGSDGKIWYHTKVTTVGGWVQHTIELQALALPAGIYYVKLTAAGGTQIKKILKQ